MQGFLPEFKEKEVEIGDTTGFMDDATHDGVEGYDASAGDAVLAKVEDLLLGLGQTVCKAGEFGDAAFARHPDPVAQAVIGALAIGVGPDRFEGVLEQIDHGEIAVGGQQEGQVGGGRRR